MKTWMIIGAVFMLVLAAGIFVSANINSPAEDSGTCETESCPYASTEVDVVQEITAAYQLVEQQKAVLAGVGDNPHLSFHKNERR